MSILSRIILFCVIHVGTKGMRTLIRKQLGILRGKVDGMSRIFQEELGITDQKVSMSRAGSIAGQPFLLPGPTYSGPTWHMKPCPGSSAHRSSHAHLKVCSSFEIST